MTLAAYRVPFADFRTPTRVAQSPSARRSSTLTVPTPRTVGIADLSGDSVGIVAVEARRQSRIVSR